VKGHHYQSFLARLTSAKLLRCAAAALASLLPSSCASTPGHSHARFHDQDNCDAIVLFSSWDLITISKPDTRENGFLPLYRFAEAQKVLARPDFPHRLAAVICGALRSDSQEANLRKKWADLFTELGYQRVVFLEAGSRGQVNGLAVIEDRQLGDTPIAGGN
jgi:hypothetical protein